MKSCIFSAFDDASDKHRARFEKMWCDCIESMFQQPLILLKSGSMAKVVGSFEEEIAPTFESTKARVAEERNSRGQLQSSLSEKIKLIPDDDASARDAVKIVQEIMEQTFGAIRSLVADHMQLYSESFFLMPMLRRLEGVMAEMELHEEDKIRYRARRDVLDKEQKHSESILGDLVYCIGSVQRFKVTYGGDQ